MYLTARCVNCIDSFVDTTDMEVPWLGRTAVGRVGCAILIAQTGYLPSIIKPCLRLSSTRLSDVLHFKVCACGYTEVHLEDRLDDQFYGHLDNPVPDSRDTERCRIMTSVVFLVSTIISTLFLITVKCIGILYEMTLAGFL